MDLSALPPAASLLPDAPRGPFRLVLASWKKTLLFQDGTVRKQKQRRVRHLANQFSTVGPWLVNLKSENCKSSSFLGDCYFLNISFLHFSLFFLSGTPIT